MKRFYHFFAIALSVCATVACVQGVEEVETSLNYTKLTVGVANSRTELGEKINGAYQVYWSQDDQIVVNGAVSTKSDIDKDNHKVATFHFENTLLNSPYYITYPYAENSLCADGRPTVVFKAEQDYFANSFGVGYAPMCGYCEQGEASVSHLAGVMRLSVTGETTLSTIEIIAEEGIALAGEFDVNCQTTALTAVDGATTNKITYTANQQLSDEATLFHITVPHGNLGKCQVILTDNAGLKMNLKWTATDVAAGVVREFKPFAFKGGASFELQGMTSTTDGLVISESHDGVWGYIKYKDGTPANGVSVSDGYSVVTTNQIGFYQFKNGVNAKTKYIYYSLPAEAQVSYNTTNNRVEFFKSYRTSTSRYDFSLVNGVKEDEFTLFVLADTHAARQSYIDRLAAECVPGIKRERERRGASRPCYTVICGDIVCASTSTDHAEELKQVQYMKTVRNTLFTMNNTAQTPTFYVMGNHDHDRAYFDTPPYSDLAEFNLHIQDAFENNFAPANYSFNRGDVHIVCMRDILWPESCITNATSLNCYGDFTAAQVEWLRQDLANVPKTKKVILCVHIPLNTLYNSKANVKSVVDMVKAYKNPQIFSGHTHTNRDVKANSTYFSSTYQSSVDEKTIVGNWGTGSGSSGNPTLRCMGDGAPFGFDVYDVDGTSFVDHYFVDCTSNKCHKVDTDYVMRAYLSSEVYGGDSSGNGKIYESSSHVSHERYFKFYDAGSSKRQLRVNVFNGSPHTWTVTLYVNGSKAKDLTWLKTTSSYAWKNPSPSETDDNGNKPFTWSGSGSGTSTAPWYPSSYSNSQDWWYISYIINETSSGKQVANGSCHHMWYCELTSTQLNYINNGKFEIRAVHNEYGVTKTYKSSKIFTQKDHNGYMNYSEKNQ